MNKLSIISKNGQIDLSLLFWSLKVITGFLFLTLSLYFLIQGPNTSLTLVRPSYYSRRWILSSEDGNPQDNQLSHNFTDFRPILNKTGVHFWLNIQPSFICPKSLFKKVGALMDGGKWTCGLSNLGRLSRDVECVVYSFGVNRDSTFEAEVLATTHCQVYAYDPTVEVIGRPLHPSNPRVHFQKLGIGGNDTGNKRTLKTLMNQNGHRWVDILKIDVEGSEYNSLTRLMKDFPPHDGGLPVGQLLVEFHVYNWNVRWEHRDEVTTSGEIAVNFFQQLESRGLRLFSNEINTYSVYSTQCCSELSFININPFSLNRFLK